MSIRSATARDLFQDLRRALSGREVSPDRKGGDSEVPDLVAESFPPRPLPFYSGLRN
jgi:hypothetical protein